MLSLGPEAGDAAGRVDELAVGDELEVVAGTTSSMYTIVSVTKVREVGASLQERREHAACMAPTDDTRLTLIACWPSWACTHRLVFVAQRKMVAEPTLSAEDARGALRGLSQAGKRAAACSPVHEFCTSCTNGWLGEGVHGRRRSRSTAGQTSKESVC